MYNKERERDGLSELRLNNKKRFIFNADVCLSFLWITSGLHIIGESKDALRETCIIQFGTFTEPLNVKVML